MSKIMDFNETHNSVRQNGGSTGSSSIRNVFPLHPVTSKRPESPYGAKYFCLAENPVFQFFGLEIPYRTRVGPIGHKRIHLYKNNSQGGPVHMHMVPIRSAVRHARVAQISGPCCCAPPPIFYGNPMGSNGVQWGPKNWKKLGKKLKTANSRNLT